MKHAHLLQDAHLPKPDFEPIRAVLGHTMPQLMPGARGRARLTGALAQRFGENFRSNEQAQKVMQHFDDETERMRTWLSMRGVPHHG